MDTMNQEICHLFPQMCGASTVPTQPKINTNVGGVNIVTGQTTFDKVLSTFLSSLALWKGAGYVPTTVQPVGNAGYQSNDYALQQYLLQQQYANQSTGANIENFLKNNTGLLLMVGVGVVLLMSGRK